MYIPAPEILIYPGLAKLHRYPRTASCSCWLSLPCRLAARNSTRYARVAAPVERSLAPKQTCMLKA